MDSIVKLPRPIAVKPREDFSLVLTFNNGEVRCFDVTPYLAYPAFEALKASPFFMQAHIAHHTVVWNDDVDIAPESLYIDSAPM